MKKIFFYVVSFLFWSTCLVFAQVPASQDTIVIEGGINNVGSIENTINGDTTAGAVRINPNRIYVLKANTIYYVQAQILFGSDNDTSSTLNIIGQTGGILPIILEVPANGGNAFSDQINGNFTIKNVYWAAKTPTGSQADLFAINHVGRRLIMDNVVTEFGGNNLFGFNQGHSKLYLTNCYFRDMNWFQNSWNSTIYANSGMDTCWVENCTLTNPGLGFYLNNTIVFGYFNHNTFVNSTKYGITKIQYETGYFVNNIFVNQNWEGECSGTMYTQNDTHTALGTACIDSCEVPAEALLWQSEQGFVPKQTEVKYLNSNNVHFTDAILNEYYNGSFTEGKAQWPLSSRNWAPWAADSTDGNLRVQNVPPIFISDFTVNLAKAYKNIVIDSATISYADPKLHTPGIATEAKLEAMVRFSESNYGVLPADKTYDAATDAPKFTFGDYDANTIPGYNTSGVKSEDGNGISKISDLIEDFSYDANLTSTIDGKKLGALTWWANGLSGYDSKAELQQVESYYNKKITAVEKTNNNLPSNYSLSQNYPNPFNPSTVINFSIPQSNNVKIAVYDLLGREVATLVNKEMKAGNYSITWNAANNASGTYFYTISTPGFTSSRKMILLK